MSNNTADLNTKKVEGSRTPVANVISSFKKLLKSKSKNAVIKIATELLIEGLLLHEEMKELKKLYTELQDATPEKEK